MSRLLVRFAKTWQNMAPDLKRYSPAKLQADLGAGVTVGIIALPLSLALAIATGVPPMLGLYTAAIAGFLAAICAGSPFSVSGPAAAMVPILAAIVQEQGLSQLPLIGIIAALLLVLFAVAGLGRLIYRVPESVILGFTAGVAVVIFVSQINGFLGIHSAGHAESFTDKVAGIVSFLPTLNPLTVALGGLGLAIILFGHYLPGMKKVPTTLIAVVVVTLCALLPVFQGVATLGNTYGQLQLGFPALPTVALANLSDISLWLAAFKIAALIAVESLLCAVVADRLTKSRHDPNQELVAQGIANAGSALFGGMPATAVIARSGTIIKAGAESRVASLVHAVVVAAFIIALAPLASAIPLTVLCGVLLVTSVRISEYQEIKHFVTRKSWRLSSVLVVTMLLTIFIDLVAGVTAGLILHFLLITLHRVRNTLRDRDGEIRLAEEEQV